MYKVFLNLGSNLGDRYENLKKAVFLISSLEDTFVERVSAVYETEPMYTNETQNFYLNCCIKVGTKFDPKMFLGCCIGIETAMGRTRPYKNSARIIDIDIIMCENFEINEEKISIPHKLWRERLFVLLPLIEICENGVLLGNNLNEMLKSCQKIHIKKYKPLA